MKQLILALTLTALALAPSLRADDSKPADQKPACCEKAKGTCPMKEGTCPKKEGAAEKGCCPKAGEQKSCPMQKDAPKKS